MDAPRERLRQACLAEAEGFEPTASTFGILLELAHGDDSPETAAAARRFLEAFFEELAGG